MVIVTSNCYETTDPTVIMFASLQSSVLSTVIEIFPNDKTHRCDSYRKVGSHTDGLLCCVLKKKKKKKDTFLDDTTLVVEKISI